MKKLTVLLSLTTLLISCQKFEYQKEVDIKFFNYSDDEVKKIEVRLFEDETRRPLDIVTINKSIPQGDSLLFKFNSENFITFSATSVPVFFFVYFENQEPIVFDGGKKDQVTYYISGKEENHQLVYIGNKRLVRCLRPKEGIDLLPSTYSVPCNLDSLNYQ